MKSIIIVILLSVTLASEVLSFGAISTVDKEIMEKKLTPLIHYIEKVISKELIFKTGFNYTDTIEKFRTGAYDLGFIGPSPFVFANYNNDAPLKIIAGLDNADDGYFYGVIVAKKGSKITKLSDLKGKSFAFGSPRSTLSYFMPMYLLQQRGLDKEISNYVFLGKHDKVAKYIIMRKYDVGAIKESVANKYKKYLQIIANSEKVPDFIIVASSRMPDTLVTKIRNALLKDEGIEIAKLIKPQAIGFRLREESDYNRLREIMLSVAPDALNGI